MDLAKVGKLVFDTSVTPHWLETGDRFWYSYETSQGKKWWMVDPAKKTKAPMFDNAKMAAMLTGLTRIPYEAQHLPINTIKFIKNDTAFQFDANVPSRRRDSRREERGSGATRAEQGKGEENKDQDDPQRSEAGRSERSATTAAAAHTSHLFRIRTRDGQAHAADRFQAASEAALGIGLAGREDHHFRPRPQPVHDGR